MPYQWTTTAEAPVQEMRLWPHESLPARGMVAFVLATFVLILIPALALLGTPIMWGLLPFLLAAVGGIYFALQRNHRSRQILEILTVSPETTRLVRTDPDGQIREWDCNRHWCQVLKYEKEGPIPHYVTLRGMGREVEIGAFLSEDERIDLYEELARTLPQTNKAG